MFELASLLKASVGILLLVSTTAVASGRRTTNLESKTPTSQRSKFEGLLADQIRVNQEKMRLDSIAALSDDDVEEGDLFDVDGLYEGQWNTEFVHPYKNGKLTLPDSLRISCLDWYMPHMGYVTSNFGPRWRRMHYGVDLKVQIGDPIHSAFPGKVRVVGYHRSGYGKYVVVRHTNGLETVYAHLSAHNVQSGQEVHAGDIIGLGGNTGRSTGPHLHFEIRLLGVAINPVEIFDFTNKVAHRDYYMFHSRKPSHASHPSVKPHAASSPSYEYHKVRSGETLSAIARKYGISLTSLCKINKLSTRSKLRIGQVIRLS